MPGVGLVKFLGQRQYSMRAWLDPQKLASLDLTASEVIEAISEQNVEVAAGNIGQQPVPAGQDYQLVLNTLGRLTTPEQFGEIIVKVGEDGRYVRLRDVARIELGAQNSDLRLHAHHASSDGKVISAIRRWPWPSFRCHGQRAGRRRGRQDEDGGAQEEVSRRASTTASPTTPRRSSSTRSTTCSTRSSSRRPW